MNVKFAQPVRIPRKEIKRAHLEGFWLGVKATLAYLNDVENFSDEDLQHTAEGARDLMYSVADGTDDWKKVDKALSKMVGNITFVEV